MNFPAAVSRSHSVNTKRLFALLSAALFHDTFDSRIKADVCSFSFLNFPNSLGDLGAIISIAVREFASKFQISKNFAYRFLNSYASQFPTLSALILDHSSLSPAEKLKLSNDILISIASTPIGMSLILSWHLASGNKSSFIDLNNVNILKELPPNQLAFHGENIVLGPHLSVSFGHLSLLMEALIAFDNARASFDPGYEVELGIKYFYLENSDCAYSPLKIGNLFDFPQSNIQIEFENLQLVQAISKLAPLATHTEGISSNIAINILDRSGIYTRTSVGSLKNANFSNAWIFSAIREDSVEELFRQNVDQQIDDASLSSTVVDFISNCSGIVAIHSRDASYSGHGQPWRDSTFDNYNLAIDFLNSKGIGVVRLSRSAHEYKHQHQLFLDLSLGQYSLFDQLFVLRNSLFLIGTDSGISHWWYLYRTPTLFLNTSVLEPSGIIDSCLVSPKRPTICSRDILEFNRLSFSSVWPMYLIESMQSRELTPPEILADVSYFFNNLNQSMCAYPTLHSLYSELEIDRSALHDSFITPSFYEYMLSLCA